MPIIAMPDGTHVNFPDNMPREQIKGLIAQKFPDIIKQQPPSATSFINRQIAAGLGAPVDIAAAGLGALGLETKAPFGGSESISNLFESLGIEVAPPEARAETLGQQVASGVGDVASMLLPFGGAAQAVSKGVGIVGNIAKDILETFARRPKAALGLELVAGVGAGAGGYAAEQAFPESPAAKVTGQILGGITAPTSIIAAGLPTRVGMRVAKKTFAPFTETGGRIRAEERVKGLVEDPAIAARRLREETITDLTPAQRIGEKRLLSLEKEVLDQDVKLEGEFTKRSAANLQKLRSRLETEGDVGALRGIVEDRVTRLQTSLDTRTQQAVDKAEQRVFKLAPSQRQSQASIIARDELEGALKSARSQERELWDAVPEVDVDITGSKRAYRTLYKATPKAQREDIPAIAKALLKKQPKDKKALKVFKGLRNIDKLKEAQGLRSKLLEESRRARADGNYNKARISDNIADSLLDDMSASAGGDELAEALAFSRGVNEKFKQGTVGKLLGTERVGGGKVAPELTLETSVGAGRARGDVALQDILKAADTPQLRQSVDQYLLGNLENIAIRDGQLNPQAAKRFIKQNEELLAKFPERKQQILDAVEATEKAGRIGKQGERITKNLTNTRKSRAAEFLNMPIDVEFDKILSKTTKNPRQFLLQLKSQASKDTTGEAQKGLKAGLVDSLMRKATTSQLDEQGFPIISGKALLNNLTDKRIKDSLSAILTKPEMNQLKTIAKELRKFEDVKLPNIQGIINDTPHLLLTTFARVVGARAGGEFSKGSAGGSLQTAQIFSSNARKLIQRLTNDKARQILIEAVQDPELMHTLLTNTTTQMGRRKVNRRLNAWITTPVGTAFSEE